jgi:hypothetical protein
VRPSPGRSAQTGNDIRSAIKVLLVMKKPRCRRIPGGPAAVVAAAPKFPKPEQAA